MNTAAEVAKQIETLKASRIPLQEVAWKTEFAVPDLPRATRAWHLRAIASSSRESNSRRQSAIFSDTSGDTPEEAIVDRRLSTVSA